MQIMTDLSSSMTDNRMITNENTEQVRNRISMMAVSVSKVWMRLMVPRNKCWFSTQIPKDPADIPIPKPVRKGETAEQQKARLLYQSRKRGMLENGLLFSTFVDKHLENMNAELLNQYDKLINEPSNDWDIYYWLTGKEEPPAQFKNEVFEMLKNHTQNKLHEQRYRQPDIRFS